MSLEQDPLREGSGTKKGTSSPRYKYQADNVNLENLHWAQSGIAVLEKEFAEAKSLDKQKKIIDTMKFALVRIDAEIDNPSNSLQRREELIKIRGEFHHSVKNLTKQQDSKVVKATTKGKKTPIDELQHPEHKKSLRETIDSQYSAESTKRAAQEALDILNDPQEYAKWKKGLEDRRDEIIKLTNKYYEYKDKQIALSERYEQILDKHLTIHDLDNIQQFKEDYSKAYSDLELKAHELKTEMHGLERVSQFDYEKLTANSRYADIFDHYVNPFATISNKRNKGKARKEPMSTYEFSEKLNAKTIVLRKRRTSDLASSTSDTKIIAFSTNKKGYVQRADGSWFAIGKQGVANPVSQKAVENALKEKERVYLTKDDRISKADRHALDFLVAFESTKTYDFDFPIPDKWGIGEHTFTTNTPGGGTGKTTLDSTKAVAFVYNKPKDKKVQMDYAPLAVPDLKELKKMKKGLSAHSSYDAKTLEYKYGKGKKYSSSYSIAYLVAVRKMFPNADVKFGVMHSDRENKSQKPLVATEPKTGNQIILAPTVERR